MLHLLPQSSSSFTMMINPYSSKENVTQSPVCEKIDISTLASQALQSHPFPMTHQSNNVYENKQKKDIVTYLHKAALSPILSIWIDAITVGIFTAWLGLTDELVKKHLESPPATVKGYLR